MVVQLLVLLAVYSVVSLVGDTSWSIAGAGLRTWSARSPRRVELLIAAGGACLVGLALLVALSDHH